MRKRECDILVVSNVLVLLESLRLFLARNRMYGPYTCGDNDHFHNTPCAIELETYSCPNYTYPKTSSTSERESENGNPRTI